MNILKKYIVWIVVIVFVAAMLSFTMTYTVRFTESAIVTRFGRALVSKDGNPKGTPGLHFKWFYPIDSVTKYDRRTHFLQARSETQQTADDFQIVVEGFATYKVTDPLTFYRRFSQAGPRAIDHFRDAETVLRSRLRSALAETSKYRMSELFNDGQHGSKLPELEDAVLKAMNEGGAESTDGSVAEGSLAEYGIQVTMVGIDRVVLPEGTTESVMDRMAANRERLAGQYSSEGLAIAQTIRASADADAQRIRAFAQSRAKEIVARGEEEAAQFLEKQNDEPELAIFIQNLELLRDALAKRVTLVLSTDTFGMKVFNPSVAEQLDQGKLPEGSLDEQLHMTEASNKPEGGK